MTDPNSRPKPAGEALAANQGDAAKVNSDKSGDTPSGAKPKPASDQASRPQIDSMRETVESIAVAFILAFLFRTFVAEAFVIPTGSMATTLMGRHKDVECPNCKYHFQASASSEADDDGNPIPGAKVYSALCPNCGFPVDTGDDAAFPSYRGDRIIVSKLAVDSLKRWDVTVFHYPERAGTNYIKRLVGVPGERLRIFDGDLFSRKIGPEEAELLQKLHDHREALRALRSDQGGHRFAPGDELQGDKETALDKTVKEIQDKLERIEKDKEPEYHVLRKPPEVVLAMLREVYNNDYVVDWMTEAGWPPRWQPCPMDIDSLVKSGWGQHDAGAWPWTPKEKPAPGQWQTDDGYRSFHTDGSAGGDVWLRYQHVVAFEGPQWIELIKRAPDQVKRSYYSNSSGDRNRDEVPATKDPIRDRPPLRLIDDFTAYNYALSKGGRNNMYGQPETRPWVGDLAIGCRVEASKKGDVIFELMKAGHRFHCRLALAERTASVSIDDGQVHFTDEQGNRTKATAAANTAIPTGKAFDVLFANVDAQLLLWINGSVVTFDSPTTYDLPIAQTDRRTSDYAPVAICSRGAEAKVTQLRILRDTYYLTHFGDYGGYYPEKEAEGKTYPLLADQFFVMGDNSPQSADARGWSEPYVERKLLIGKALFIFWPHSWDSPVPFTPNWKRMKFIR